MPQRPPSRLPRQPKTRHPSHQPNRVKTRRPARRRASLLKIQTTLPQFDPELEEATGYTGVEPVQQWSAQPLKFLDDYVSGSSHPREFWTGTDPDPASTQHWGASRHRADSKGGYLAVGVRGSAPEGDLPTRGPARPRRGQSGYPQDMGVRVISREQMQEMDPNRIVVMPRTVQKEAHSLVKHAESPEAKRHKSEYDTAHEKSPARVKYRVDLNRERHKRGIYGRGGPDMSHTKRGTLVAEDPHRNRARHFRERGTLKGQVRLLHKMGEEEAWALEEQMLGEEGERRLSTPRTRRKVRSMGTGRPSAPGESRGEAGAVREPSKRDLRAMQAKQAREAEKERLAAQRAAIQGTDIEQPKTHPGDVHLPMETQFSYHGADDPFAHHRARLYTQMNAPKEERVNIREPPIPDELHRQLTEAEARDDFTEMARLLSEIDNLPVMPYSREDVGERERKEVFDEPIGRRTPQGSEESLELLERLRQRIGDQPKSVHDLLREQGWRQNVQAHIFGEEEDPEQARTSPTLEDVMGVAEGFPKGMESVDSLAAGLGLDRDEISHLLGSEGVARRAAIPSVTQNELLMIPQNPDRPHPPESRLHGPTMFKVPFSEDTGFTTGEPMDLAMRLLKWEGEEEFNMMIALQEQAYALAEQEMPFDPEKHSDWVEWQEDIEPLGEYLLMHMMEDPEWGHVRDLYGQHSNAPPNYGDPPFKERDDIIDFYRNQGLPMPGESIAVRGDGGRPVELKPVGSKPTMHEVEGQPEFPTGTLFNERTGFTTGEPMDIAMRLLKDDEAPNPYEWRQMGYESGEEPPQREIVSENCVWCGADVSRGSGLFANRVYTSTDEVDGWACRMCAGEECELCGTQIEVDDEVRLTTDIDDEGNEYLRHYDYQKDGEHDGNFHWGCHLQYAAKMGIPFIDDNPEGDGL